MGVRVVDEGGLLKEEIFSLFERGLVDCGSSEGFFARFAVDEKFDWESAIFIDCVTDGVLVEFVQHNPHYLNICIGEHFSELIIKSLERIRVSFD